jgi:hypothetical protein
MNIGLHLKYDSVCVDTRKAQKTIILQILLEVQVFNSTEGRFKILFINSQSVSSLLDEH